MAGDDKIKFTTKDIKEELDYLKLSLVGFVLGVNPPFKVFKGVIHKWGTKLIRLY